MGSRTVSRAAPTPGPRAGRSYRPKCATTCCTFGNRSLPNRGLVRRLACLRGVARPKSLLWIQPHGSPWGSATRQGSRPVAPEIHPPSEMDGLTNRST